MGGRATRLLVVWCPDWPVTAAGKGADEAVAVIAAGVVLACSGPARTAGVERGQRRRQAQAHCPRLVVVDHDPGHDARAFEPVVAAVAAFTPSVEVVRPGVCSLPTRGPARYFGGEEALAALVAEAVGTATPGHSATPATLGHSASDAGRCRIGVADGRFAAEQAARRGLVVPVGASAAFLAPLPVASLGPSHAGLSDLLRRLGVRTLGDLAALPARAVLARFGTEGAGVRRIARGLDEHLPSAVRPPPDLDAEATFDPPAESLEAVAFVARGLADELSAALGIRGLAAARVAVEVETEWGETFRRIWRLEGVAAGALAQRVRWQLEAWLAEGRAGPLTRLRLVPEEVCPDGGRQEGFWGGDRVVEEKVASTLARIQGRLGPEAVVTAVAAGGRGPAEQYRLVPWGDPVPASTPARGRRAGDPPWPGRLPAPAPATVHTVARPAEVVDAGGVPVGVGGRGLSTAPPARLALEGGRWEAVVAWAGPWPLDERWWDPSAHRRRARWQVVTEGGDAHLLVLEGGRWWLEATYD